jgi:cyclopropane fatty-acyl-phospholipid synthase-like methyltransferase
MKKGENEMMKLPNLAEMTNIQAIHWYTNEFLRLSREGQLNSEYGKALLEWKKQLNARLEQSRKEWW